MTSAEKQALKEKDMREHWANVFNNESIDRMSVIKAINDAYDESFDKESYKDKVTHRVMDILAEPAYPTKPCDVCIYAFPTDKPRPCSKCPAEGRDITVWKRGAHIEWI